MTPEQPDDADPPQESTPPGARRDERLVTGRDRTLAIGAAKLIAQVARSVAYLELIFEAGQRAEGTGFLIAPDLLLTNHHNVVHEEYGPIRTMTADFDRDEDSREGRLVVKGIIPPVAKSAEHDWAVLRLERRVTDRTPIALGSLWPITKDDPIIIIQHPLGGFKRFALDALSLQCFDDDVIQYLADTQKGSSGSPVFNSRLHCIALHHAEAEVAVEEGKKAATGWRNEGIRIERVMEGLRGAGIPFDDDAEGFIKRVEQLAQSTGAPEAAEQRALDEYLRAYYDRLAERCEQLPLGVIYDRFLSSTGEQPALLRDIYVDLDVTSPDKRAESDKSASPAMRRKYALALARGEGNDRTSVLDVIAGKTGARVVLLGDAGSGKTTFVDYLTYLLASDAPGLPESLSGLLPVRLTLRDVNVKHVPPDADKGTAQMIWHALADDLASCLGKPAADRLMPHLQQRLLSEGGVFLLDGLDEVPAARERRRVLLEAVQDFASLFRRQPRSRIIVTARPYAYADPQWHLHGFATQSLAPFSEAQVRRFIRRWYEAVRVAMRWSEDAARDRGADLARRVLDQDRPYLGDLASRPLLLTLIATTECSSGHLPEDRADLYEQNVQLLLGRWQQARDVRDQDGRLREPEKGISEALGEGEDRIRDALQRLAYTIHDRQGKGPDRDDAPADISAVELLVAFEPLLGKATREDFLVFLKNRAGLLVARDEDEEIYAFLHRSFQEYLAACSQTKSLGLGRKLRKLAADDPEWWREVCLLAIGKVRQGSLGHAVDTVNALIPENPDDCDEIADREWRLAALASQALVELRLFERASADELDEYLPIVKRARRWLVRLVEEGHLNARERAEAGDVLAQLEDPRFDPKVYHLPCRYRGKPEPNHGFVKIEAGPFVMGSREGDRDAFPDEYGNPGDPPQAEVHTPFWIARYPVTVAQFGDFMADHAYDESGWWTRTGWAWRLGEYDSQVEEKNLKAWLARRPRDLRGAPMWWDEQRRYRNRPVMGVSWFEAMAYCRWLDARLHGAASWIPAGYDVQLPTEAQWEKAARAGDARRYPWGDEDWDQTRANIEGIVGRASPVGMYPKGVTLSTELHDMSGNVWEWTRSQYEPYPYRDDERNDPDAEGPRVVRGGSWLNSQRYARCAYRVWDDPDYFNDNVGFREALSLSS
jgi:formylglycine-generating enzyme required for sulfatase activity/V8-like Glu-specific endopeptidase